MSVLPPFKRFISLSKSDMYSASCLFRNIAYSCSAFSLASNAETFPVPSNIDVFLTQKMKILSLFTVREKVAYLLLERAGEQGSNEIHLERSRQEIADSFGIQKFSLLRVLSDLEKEGAIEIKGKIIKILNRRGLAG